MLISFIVGNTNGNKFYSWEYKCLFVSNVGIIKVIGNTFGNG